MVVAEITRWPTATRPALGRVQEVLGPIDAPGVDVAVIIHKYGLNDVHPAAVIAEAKRLGTVVRERDIQGRTDFRTWPTVTIDGEHARDFDDAISIDRLPNGNYWLGVHIADVSHYVTDGSALDADAYERSTSVYFPDRAVHMFPVGAVDRTLQPESARGSAGAIVPDGSRSPHRRRGPLRNPRRRDQQPGADDLHGRQRDSDGSQSRHDRAVSAARADVRTDARAVHDSQRAAPPPGIDRLRSPRIGNRARRGRSRGSDHRLGAERRASADRRVHAARQRNRGGASREPSRADAVSRARRSGSRQGGGVRGVSLDPRLFAQPDGGCAGAAAISRSSSQASPASRKSGRSRS